MLDLLNKKYYYKFSKRKARLDLAVEKWALPEPACLASINLDNTTGGVYMQEIWKDIPDYEGLYQASSLGNIRSLKYNKIIKQFVLYNKRHTVHLYKNGLVKNFYIHRLVALAFIKNPYNKEDINHKDGNPENNNLNNLEWATRKENILHSYRILKRGHLKKIFCLTNNKTYFSVNDASRELKINQGNLSSVLHGKLKHANGFRFIFI